MQTPSLSARTSAGPASASPRRWIPITAAGGVAWNLFGVYQWIHSLGANTERLMAGGLSRAQAELYLSLPAWMDVAFGIGVLGGLLGSAALLARRRVAVPVLGASLAAYAVLFAGDAGFGLFAAIPGQLAILCVVLLIAAGLFIAARQARASQALG